MYVPSDYNGGWREHAWQRLYEEAGKNQRAQEIVSAFNTLYKIYTDDLPKRVPLADNKEFNSIRNAVVKEALNIMGFNFGEPRLPLIRLSEANRIKLKKELDNLQ